MRSTSPLCIVLGLLAWSGSTAAAGKAGDETGLEIGLRTGYAIPFGKGGANASADLNEAISGAVPIWLDLGYRATPEMMVGIYGAYAFGFLGETIERACTGVDCSWSDIRLGAELHYHILPRDQADPWLGLGFGYEWLAFSASGGTQGGEGSFTASGFEFFNLQAGVDFAPSDQVNVGIGPFLAFSVAQYDNLSCSGAGFACGGSVEPTTHEWLTLGVRGTVVP